MPKEYVNNRWYDQTARTHETCDRQGMPHCPPDCPGVEVCADSSSVKIGWAKEQEHVDLSVLPHRDGLDTMDELNFIHAQLDRSGINRLIRLLRKARDEAFGADA